jgi:acetone carboxylase gamma subunit
VQRINEYLRLDGDGDERTVVCRCGHVIGPATENYKLHLLMRERPVQAAGPWVDPNHIGGDAFVCREFFCPGCVTLLDVEIAQRGEPILWDVRPAGVPDGERTAT